MLFCCCFCRAAAVSPKKVEEDNISSWRPQQTQTEQVNSIRKSSLVGGVRRTRFTSGLTRFKPILNRIWFKLVHTNPGLNQGRPGGDGAIVYPV